MKKYLLLIFSITILLCAHSQTYSVFWGKETKLRNGSLDFDIINVDETGVYVIESIIQMKSYFVVGGTFGRAAKLIKFDKFNNEVFQLDYKNFLKDYDFKSIQFLKSTMYLFAHQYNKKEKKFTISGVKLDKKTGEPNGDFQELASFQLEDKKDYFEFNFKPTPDSSAWMLVGNVSTDVNSTIVIHNFDENLKKAGTPTKINLNFAPQTFTLEDVLQTVDGKYLLMGQKFELIPTGKKNKTTRTFTNYLFNKYDNKGKKEMELPTNMPGKYVTSAKAIYFPNGELLLSGFYGSDPKKKDVTGVYINRIDVNSGNVIASSFKEIDANMLDQAVADDADMEAEDKRVKQLMDKAKEKGEEDSPLKDFVIKGIEFDQQKNSLLILAEISKFRRWSSSRSSYGNSGWSHSYSENFEFTNSDIILIKADGQGQIAWINTLPKKQVELIRNASSGGGGISFSNSSYSDFFAHGGGMPFYSSFSYLLSGDKLVLLINDHPENREVQKLGDKFKAISNFKKSAAFAVSVDLNTGKFTRKLLLTHDDEVILMPKFGYIIGKEFLLPAAKMKALGKTQFKVGKVAVKSL